VEGGVDILGEGTIRREINQKRGLSVGGGTQDRFVQMLLTFPIGGEIILLLEKKKTNISGQVGGVGGEGQKKPTGRERTT